MPPHSIDFREMELNPFNLSFPRDLEANFLDDYFKNSLPIVRLSLFAGIFFYALFGILDAILASPVKSELWLIRFVVVCPSLLGVILCSFFFLF